MPKRRVLIADDTALIRQLICGFLKQRPDIEVCAEAANGLEAVEKAIELKPDLVLLDISMPLMSGIEAASILKKRLPDTAIIVFTLSIDHYRPALMEAIGVDAVLAKEDGLEVLMDTIDSVFERRNRPSTDNP